MTGTVSGQVAQPVTLVFASGMAEIQPDKALGGLPHLATLLKESRAQNRHVLFLHGGAALSPSILSTIDRGAHMISILNMLEPDVMALGKSEFAHTEDELTLRTVEASFPFVNSNVLDQLTKNTIEGIYPYQLIDVGDYTVGIMSLVDPDVIGEYMPKRVHLADTKEVLHQTSLTLKAKGADIIILMADFRLQNIDKLLAQKIVDIAFISDPSINPLPGQQKSKYYELNSHSGVACLYTLTLEDRGKQFSWRGEATTVSLNDFHEDPEVAEKIESYLAQFSNILNTVVGKTLTPIDTRRYALRTGENGFGNLIADILRDFYKSDFALLNGGGIRGNRLYPAGSLLTRGDILREFPFNNRLVNIKVTGRQLLQSLENGLSRIEEGKGRFPHVSGMRVRYNPENPPDKRVVDVKVVGKPLQLNKTYTLATHDYIATGGDGYVALKDCAKLVKIGGGRMLWEYVRNGIAERVEISPQIDGRMQAVTQK